MWWRSASTWESHHQTEDRTVRLTQRLYSRRVWADSISSGRWRSFISVSCSKHSYNWLNKLIRKSWLCDWLQTGSTGGGEQVTEQTSIHRSWITLIFWQRHLSDNIWLLLAIRQYFTCYNKIISQIMDKYSTFHLIALHLSFVVPGHLYNWLETNIAKLLSREGVTIFLIIPMLLYFKMERKCFCKA